ncbi:MAG: phenylalanine--tRNA ligase subunit beta [Patescibacteria group bacterium]|nr:MAG: phenylalanine--tRNA ligase subunit beta [Patescibacteria group bacterium]
MNIKLSYNWIQDYFKTDLSAQDFADRLSLVGPSIERIEKFSDDFVFDIEITPNRVDMACVLGIAQEANAAFSSSEGKFFNPFAKFNYSKFKQGFSGLGQNFEISLLSDGATRYIAVAFSGVRVGPSPDFIAKRLTAVGIKTINNIVDISNYVMLELGQPNHIFDLNRIAKAELKMKRIEKPEKITLLDNRTVRLEKGDLVFIDGDKRLVDLCGIMGGSLSSVVDQTETILITVPVYDKLSIRRTSMRLGIRTDAAVLFEKGIDEERSEWAVKLLCDLLSKYAGGRPASEIWDFYPEPYKPIKIKSDYQRIVELIGVKISRDQIKTILERLGFAVEIDSDKFVITVPFYRKNDIATVQDIVEETARVYGYHKLPSRLSPFVLVKADEKIEKVFEYQSRVKHLLADLGFNEVMNYSMTDEQTIKKFREDVNNYLKITVPISKRLEYMRQYLFPSLFDNAVANQGFVDEFKLFELAKVYFKKPLVEELRLSILTSADYYYQQAVVRHIFESFNIYDYDFVQSQYSFLASRQADIIVKNKVIGFCGELKESLPDTKVFSVSEVNFEALVELAVKIKAVKPLPKYAVIKFDLNFELTDNLKFSDIKTTAFKHLKNLYDLEVVDVYKNKRLTIRFFFTSFDKNLTEEFVKKQMRKLVDLLGVSDKFNF